MDMYNSSGNMYGQPVSGNHSDRMEIAAMTPIRPATCTDNLFPAIILTVWRLPL